MTRGVESPRLVAWACGKPQASFLPGIGARSPWGRLVASHDRELFRLLDPVVAAQGVGLVEIALVGGGRRSTLRVVIHSEGGVSHGDCARVTRAIGDAVEDAGILSGGYDLEVSSPGLRRVLKQPGEFDLFRGQVVRVWVAEGEAQGEVVGVSEGTRDGGVVLRLEDGSESVIPWSQVTKARLDPEGAASRGLGGKGR